MLSALRVYTHTRETGFWPYRRSRTAADQTGVFSARIINIWNSLPNSVVDVCTANAFKERLDKFWQHQAVKFDFTADLTVTGNRSEEVMK